MNICMVLAGQDFPPDIRVEKEALALRGAGHAVTIVSDLRSDRPVEDEWEGCHVLRIPRPSAPAYALEKVREILLHRNARWEGTLRRLVAEDAVDVLHVHDLPMVGPVLRVARQTGARVVADLHENYPAATRVWGTGGGSWKTWLARLLHLGGRWASRETRWVREADLTIVVVDEARDRLVAEGADPDRVRVIENTADLDGIWAAPDPTPDVGEPDDFIISYIGGFGGLHRGLDLAVAAMPAVLASIPRARLLLVGDGAIKPTLARMAEQHGVRDRVTFLDWQPVSEVPGLIRRSHVCLVPHRSNPHTDATSPHKLFQYMLLERPVVVSSCPPLRRVVEETGAGRVFEAGDPESLAEAILSLEDPAVRAALGAAGRKAVLDTYNWPATARQLQAIYQELSRAA